MSFDSFFTMFFRIKSLTYILPLIIFISCEKNPFTEPSKKSINKYNGPLSESTNFSLIYSDSAKVKVKVIAKKQAQFENGDWELKDSLRVYFYDQDMTVYSQMKADKAIFNKQKNVWRITGNVEARNLKKEQVMTTEEIFWDPNKRKIYNSVPVRIESPTDLLNGQNGFEAEQDFSEYVFRKPSGSFVVQDLDEEP